MTLDLSGILNPAQLEAATHEGGPLLIIAGAGTGKTRTLVHRVAWLVSRGVDPRRILLLTFTRKAAGEMLGRCAELVGPEAGRVAGGTFHSTANLILRSEHRAAGFPPGFGILAQDDAESMIGRIRETIPAAKAAKRFPKKEKILQVISRAVNKEMSIKDTIKLYFAHLEDFRKSIEEMAALYTRAKTRQAVMDFDDLLVNLSLLMARDPAARERIAGRYSHVLVDEYQDTNPVQARITWQLAKDHRNVTAVGDDAQSIYGFRGADFKNIMEFPQIFDPVTVLKLEDNYRSYANILAVANGIFRGAKQRYEKTLRAARGEGPPPLIVVPRDIRGEAAWAGERIAELVRTGTDPGEIAALFRAGSHSFELELELTRRNIPYTKHGGRRFLEGAHVKDFLCFFRVAHNPADEASLSRALVMIPGIGVKGADEAIAWVGGDRERLMDLEGAPFRGRGRFGTGLGGLAKLLRTICPDDDAMGTRPRAVMKYYAPLMERLYPDDHPDRLEDVMELSGMAEESGSLSSFLADVTLDPPNTVSKGEARGERRDVTLSTIHSAKGLEWGKVFLLSAVDGRIPSSYATFNDDEMEEERRLFYVAVTRAKDELYLMCPDELSTWEGPVSAEPTRFLSGLPKGAVDVIGIGRKLTYRKLFPDSQDQYDGFSDSDSGWGDGFSVDSERASTPTRRRRSRTASPSAYASTGSSGSSAPSEGSADSGERVSEPVKGERVRHQAFGEGTVVSFREGKAVIDFDACGKKTIVCRHARLYRVKGT
ncbi:MAG: ATP-dependent helicase [Deltaproteobacteria bacterium]|jgi:DNA helicase-2/ATP-dependent DNA helicase PcrA|nr:ATP-dependent helicase [Deltaproteobacteria bacterium]